MCVREREGGRERERVHVCMNKSVCVHVCMHACVCVRACVRVCVCVCVHGVHVHMCMKGTMGAYASACFCLSMVIDKCSGLA